MSAPTTPGGQTCWNCRQPLPPGSARCVYCGSPQQAQSAPLVVAPHGVVAAAPPPSAPVPAAPGPAGPAAYGAPGAPGMPGGAPGAPFVGGQAGSPAPAAIASARGIVHGQRAAGVGARLAALTIDALVVAAVGVGAQLLLRSPVLTAVIVAELLLGLVVLQARTGLGLGNLLLRIRVARLDRPWSPGLGRSLLRGVVTSAGWLVGGLGAWFVELTAAFDGTGRRRSWGDLAAGTVVVAVPKRSARAAAPALPGARPVSAPGTAPAAGMPVAAPALASAAVPLSLDPSSGLGGVPATSSAPAPQPGVLPGGIAPMPGLAPAATGQPGAVPPMQPGQPQQPQPAQPGAYPPGAGQPPVAPQPGHPGGFARQGAPQQPGQQHPIQPVHPSSVAPPPGVVPPAGSPSVPPVSGQPGAQPGAAAQSGAAALPVAPAQPTPPQPAPAQPGTPAGERQGAGGRVAYSLPPEQPAPASAPADQGRGAGSPGDWHTELTLTELRGRARVVLTFDTGQQEQAPIPATVLLGRNPTADDALEIAVAVRDPESTVSKGHARLELTRQGTWVTDTGSTNGTFLVDETGEAERLAPGVRTPVDDGARVRLGNRVFTISTLLEESE
ncbi:hypothetical protein GCM10027515_08520 [Schumannella luteola]|uniref:FHA domain-containing protein n=1 Tax=Schumannella luteola TaxID=472059 RepID=A0A852YJU1_9MICO|nr:FHA domain-containing protein [Schumannella luteola]NYG98019.1 hypothetical protein [Schumannella luteola]TPX01751.1 FHA domain-containing protein [Schumannella luteola]